MEWHFVSRTTFIPEVEIESGDEAAGLVSQNPSL
jgi:hypothetical protein